MAKYDAYGTKLYRGTSGAGTLIAQIQAISGPGLSLDTEDVTSLDSTGAWEEVVGTILRSGEVTLDIVYDPAAATHKYASGGLLYDMALRTATTYTLVFPDTGATEWVFSAFVVGFEPSAPHDGALTASVTLKPTGSMTLA
jgi:predicted secreted protein